MLDILEIILLVIIAWFVVYGKNEQTMRMFGKRRRLILDSCALIDGRIVEIVNGGFLADDLIVPQFILNELQLLADGNDSHKRERARFGLDIAHQLQDSAPTPVRVIVDRTVFPDVHATDDKLLALAKKLNANLYTTDYNLGKVSAIEGVKVLNVNELAQGLRPIALPGETLNIKILQRGSSREQGVGYLDDGTMIVVDNAVRFVGKIIPVVVTRMHQTVAGKMVFGQAQVHEPPRHAPMGTAPAARHNPAATTTTAVAAQPKQNVPDSQKLHARFSRAAQHKVRKPIVS